MAKKARLKTVQVGFTAGELDPVLLGRIDKELYYKGAALLRNVAVNPQGHITRRPGTEYIDTTTSSAASIFPDQWRYEPNQCCEKLSKAKQVPCAPATELPIIVICDPPPNT